MAPSEGPPASASSIRRSITRSATSPPGENGPPVAWRNRAIWFRLLPSLASCATTAGSADGGTARPSPGRRRGGRRRTSPAWASGSNAATAARTQSDTVSPAAAAASTQADLSTSVSRTVTGLRAAPSPARGGRAIRPRPWGIEGGRRPPRRPRPDGIRDSGFRPTSRLACSTQTRTTCQLARPQRPRLPGACGPHGNRRGGGDGGWNRGYARYAASPGAPRAGRTRLAAWGLVAAVPRVATTQPLWGRGRRNPRSHFPSPPGQMPLHALRRFLTVPVALQALGFRYGSRCTPEHGGHRIPPICGGVAGVAPFAAAAGGR